uniref:Uncharacterized protein n=1 Tax=Gorilla gorilla gorilla TaxID=9595 RepID=A0A2I2ZXM5_GORGO
MPDELTEPGRATPARASSFLIENLLAAEAKGGGRATQGDGSREDEEDDDDDPEDEDAEQARRRRLQRRRQLLAVTGPGGEARARALLGPGALGLGPRPPPGPGPPFALGCGGAARWYPRAHGGYGGGLSPDSEPRQKSSRSESASRALQWEAAALFNLGKCFWVLAGFFNLTSSLASLWASSCS